jgi:hypothetical protein
MSGITLNAPVVGRKGYECTMLDVRCTFLDSRQLFQCVCCRAKKRKQITSFNMSINIYSFSGYALFHTIDFYQLATRKYPSHRKAAIMQVIMYPILFILFRFVNMHFSNNKPHAYQKFKETLPVGGTCHKRY